MKKFSLLILGVLVSVICYGKQIAFVNADKQPVKDVNCTGYSANNDSIASWVSNNKGIIDIQNANVNHLVTSHPGYNDKLITIKSIDGNNYTVTLSPSVNLQEVVVTPADVEEFDTHTTYRISQKDMARYANVLQSLNEIPNLRVLPNGGVFFEGNEDVKILIDGVEATQQEIKTLAKEDIAKVDVYSTPPLRFLTQGVSAVVDIRLKSKIHGGNIGVDVMQAFQSLKGDNSVAVNYNYKQSRFSLLYNNQNTHYRKYRLSEVLDYEFDGVHYNKTKEGLDSKDHYDDNNITLKYQINQPKNFLYNIQAGGAINRNGGTHKQKVTAGDESFLATNYLHTGYTKYNVANYFEKYLGDKGGTLCANVNYQHYSTSYNSAYNEQSDSEIAVNDSHSKYKTHLDGVFGEIQYQLPSNKLGNFMICGWGNYKHSKYVDSTFPFFQTTSALGGAAQWMGRKGMVGWYLSLGVDWSHIASTNLTKSYNLCVPSPMVNVNWKASNYVWFRFNYSYGSSSPSIAQLSETNQWIDTKLVYHGNSTLKPYKTHSAAITFIWYTKYLNMSLRGGFESSPNMICDMYTLTNDYMLQTMVNLSKYREWSSQLDMSIKPLGNNKIVFWNRIILADLKGENREYSWDGHRFQWMSILALNLEHWTCQLFYQYPGKVANGQLERPRAQCWSATVLYRPNTNLSVGVEWFMPFGNGFKESEHTINEAPVFSNLESVVMDRNNLVSLIFSYNFSFGRNRNHANPQYSNGDEDSGILHK